MMRHPSDRLLQQYLNRACGESVTSRVHLHVKSCVPCFRKLEAYMELDRKFNSAWNSERLLSPSSGFADRVMRKVKAPDPVIPDAKRRRKLWNAELIHTSIAGIATYLFLSTGILNKLPTLDGRMFGTQVQTEVTSAMQHIELVVRWISSSL